MSFYFDILVFTLWFLSALADYGQFCYVWQLKEYRFDRLRDYGSTLSGKKFFRGKRVLQKPLLFLILFLFLPINFESLAIALVAVLAIDLLYNVRSLTKRQLQYPELTTKAAGLIILSLTAEGVLLFTFLNSHLIFIVLALRWLIISIITIAAKLPTWFAKLIYLKIAGHKLLKFNYLTVIGVTGSYGKTTVKNFLAQVLSEKYKVIMTPENINTEIGVARFILKNNFSDYNIFVVEMGTYKIGEIAALCRLVKPKIGILTAISDQHLSLLGSIKNTQTAKYELLRSLPADGLAITNSDNPYCREFLPELKCRVNTFGLLNEFNPDCLIKEIISHEREINFTAVIKNNGQLNISAPVIGTHNSLNIAPVILAAKFLNLTGQEIIKACGGLKLPDKVLQTRAYGRSLILVDSYNANPQGFLAALDVLAGYHGRRKIVITRGILELGQSSQSWHETIGKKIGQVAEELIIISEDNAAPLKKGAGGIKTIVETNPEKLLEIIKDYKNQNNIILLENLLPEKVYWEIKAH